MPTAAVLLWIRHGPPLLKRPILMFSITDKGSKFHNDKEECLVLQRFLMLPHLQTLGIEMQAVLYKPLVLEELVTPLKHSHLNKHSLNSFLSKHTLLGNHFKGLQYYLDSCYLTDNGRPGVNLRSQLKDSLMVHNLLMIA